MSFTMVDFPDPLTPVTQTKLFKGKAISMFFKLNSSEKKQMMNE